MPRLCMNMNMALDGRRTENYKVACTLSHPSLMVKSRTDFSTAGHHNIKSFTLELSIIVVRLKFVCYIQI